ncbi:MAG: hypothetical protein JWN46_2999, partial [Acidimicrobiales bacterium]|nr:hypothetical protein [Acidimicrobiales bacterium]
RAWRARPAWASLAAAGAVMVLVWLPVLIDELIGRHNLTNLWRATRGRGGPVGLGFALTEVGRTIGLPPAFAMGQHRGTTLALALPWASVALAAVLIGGLLIVAGLRRWWGEVGLVGAALAALLGCAVQTARLPATTIDRAPYAFTVWHVRYWIQPLGAVLWAATAWIAVRVLVELVAGRRGTHRRPPRVAAPGAALGALACVLVVLVVPPRPAVYRAGVRQQSEIVRRLADQVAATLPRSGTYLAQITVYDASTFGGVMAELAARGYRLVVPDDTAYYWGPGAGCRRAALTGVLTFSTGDRAAPSADPPGTRTIARTQGDAGPSARLATIIGRLDRRLRQIDGVHYHPDTAARFLRSFPGHISARERQVLLPPIRHLEGFDIVTLLELQDAGVLDEPSLAPLLRDAEQAGARLYSAFGPLSRAAVRLAPAAAAQGCRH